MYVLKWLLSAEKANSSSKTLSLGCVKLATKRHTKQHKKSSLSDLWIQLLCLPATPQSMVTKTRQINHAFDTEINKYQNFNILIQSEPMWHFTHQHNGA